MARLRTAVARPPMTSSIDVTVRGIAAGGAGIADLPDGRVVFVPRTAPGDRVSIRIERSKPRWAVASLCSVIEPASDRRQPLCRLYDECGGCHLQHLPYRRQLEWKGRFVADALARIGRLSEVESPEVVASPREVGYRNRVTFTLRRLRGGRVVAGFHALHRPAHVIDVIDECVLPRAGLLEAWRMLRAGWGGGARLLPAGGRLRLTLHDASPGVVLTVEGGPAGWSAQELGEAVPELVAIWHRPADGGAELRRVGGAADEGPGPAFVQVNSEVAVLLVDHVAASAGSGRRAVDAYCGAGGYGRALVTKGWQVTGIEVDPSACEAARQGAPTGFSVLEGRVETRLGETLPVDLLIVNPPRSGLHRDVASTILEYDVPRVIYVSCDPATLARDLAMLSDRYALDATRAFDLFPQTAHVETVVVMTSR